MEVVLLVEANEKVEEILTTLGEETPQDICQKQLAGGNFEMFTISGFPLKKDISALVQFFQLEPEDVSFPPAFRLAERKEKAPPVNEVVFSTQNQQGGKHAPPVNEVVFSTQNQQGGKHAPPVNEVVFSTQNQQGGKHALPVNEVVFSTQNQQGGKHAPPVNEVVFSTQNQQGGKHSLPVNEVVFSTQNQQGGKHAPPINAEDFSRALEQAGSVLSKKCDRPHVEIKIMGREFAALIDTGATTSIASYEIVAEMGLSGMIKGCPSNVKAITAGGVVSVLGKINLEVFLGEASLLVTFFVLNRPSKTFIFGIETMSRYETQIDLFRREITMGGLKTPLLSEEEIEYKIQNKRNRIQSLCSQVCNKGLLKQILNNLLLNPGEEKYRRINVNSQTYIEKISEDPSLLTILSEEIGFVRQGEHLILENTPTCAQREKLQILSGCLSVY